MSHRPGLAARRFFRSFYHWTLLTSANYGKSSNAIRRLPAARHCLHTTAPARAEGSSRLPYRGFRGQRRRKNRVGSEEQVIRKVIFGKGGTRGPFAPQFYTELDLLNGPILATSEKPFSTFRPHEVVVRYRSRGDLLLEFAVLASELARARAKHGQSLKELAELSGARIEVRALSAQFEGIKIVAVRVSGNATEASTAINDLLAFAKRYSDNVVQSQESQPSRSLLPVQYALRARQKSQVQVELSLRVGQWRKVSRVGQLRQVPRNLGVGAMTFVAKGVALEVGLPEERRIREDSPVTAPSISLMLRGSADAVSEIHEMITEYANTWLAPTDSSPEQLGSGATDKAEIEPPHSSETVNLANQDSASSTLVDSSDGQDGEQSLSDLQEHIIYGHVQINLHGSTFATRDAIWDDLARRSWPDVRIFRSSAYNWRPDAVTVRVVGSRSAVLAGTIEVKRTVDNTLERMQVKGALMIKKLTEVYVYRFKLTGNDASNVQIQDRLNTAFQTLKDSGLIRHWSQWHEAKDEGSVWVLKAQPGLLGQVKERLLETIRESAKEFQASDIQGALMIDTPDEELPGTAESARHISTTLWAQQMAHPQEEVTETVDVESTSPAELQSENQLALPATTNSAKDERREATQKAKETKVPELTAEQRKQRIQRKQLTEDVRISLRSLTYPVALITSRVKEGPLERMENARGVTVSSFNTVTLDPHPVISFNLKVPSRSWDAIEQSQKFVVHLLEASEWGAGVADLFTKPYSQPEMGFKELQKLRVVNVRVDRDGHGPYITGSPKILVARMLAKLLPEKCVQVGDHVVVLAEVTAATRNTDHVFNKSPAGLAYARGQYRRLGDKVHPGKNDEGTPATGEHEKREGEVDSTGVAERNPKESLDLALLSDIPNWLRTLNLHKYTKNLKDMQWQDLVALDDAGLKAKGVGKGGRIRLLKVFEQVREAQSNGELLQAFEPVREAQSKGELTQTSYVPFAQNFYASQPQHIPMVDEATPEQRKRGSEVKKSAVGSYSVDERTEDLDRFFAESVSEGKGGLPMIHDALSLDEDERLPPKIHDALSLGEDESAPQKVRDAPPKVIKESEKAARPAAEEESGKSTETSNTELAQQIHEPSVADWEAVQQHEDPHASYNMDDDDLFGEMRDAKDAIAKEAAADGFGPEDIYEAVAWEDEDMDGGDSRRSRRRRAIGTMSRPSASRSSRRKFSTLSPFAGGSKRSFSSKAIVHRADEDDSHALDISAKNTTVADYLGVPDDNKPLHSPRVRSLIRFRKEIQRAEARLSTEDLSEEEVTALRDTIAQQERIIARKLAWNAAADLRIMLDKGSARVNFQRAQWLESAVEQGLKILLDDARALRQKREEGKVNAEEYAMLREQLESDHGVLQTELMRLRGVVDEDEEGGSE